MKPDEWARVKELFEAATAVPAGNREGFLADSTSDAALRREVQLLLAADESTDDWITRLSQTIAEHVSVRPVELGQTIGPYRIDELIGRGGMGVVYRAFDTRLERAVALKLVDDVSLDAAARSSLLREAQCASALNHPHICMVFDFGEFQDDPYIVMEWIDGPPLSDAARDGGLPTAMALRYGLQIAEALAHAHAGGVVHGDLKSGNIQMTRDRRAKLVDFGVARRLSREGEHSPRVGSPHGTPGYMAPEVLRGEPASERSDVWSFGCVLQELLSGTLPFSASTRSALRCAILEDAPHPLPSGVPASVRELIARCLSKEPLARYGDGGELARALGSAIAANSAQQADDRSGITAAVSSRHAAIAPEAYALYQRGNGLYRRGTKRDLLAAVQLFDEAVTLQPHFALAYAALAHACGKVHRNCDRDERWFERGNMAAQRALALQPDLPEALAATALLRYAHEEYDAAIPFARMALERKDDCEGAYATLGFALYLTDRFDEAAALADRAIETSGHDYWVYIPYWHVLQLLGQHEKAAKLADKQRRVLEWHVAWAPDNARARILLAASFADVGRRDDALRETEIAIAFDPEDPSILLNAACVNALLGLPTEALDMLRRAVQHGYWHADIVERDPDLASLRDEPEFQRLVAGLRRSQSRTPAGT